MQTFQLLEDGCMLVQLALRTKDGSVSHNVVFRKVEESPYDAA